MLEHYQLYRLSFFLGGLFLFSLLEIKFSCEKRIYLRKERWPGNFLLSIASVFLGKIVFPTGVVTFSLWAQKNSFGIFHWLELGHLVNVLLSIVILDFALYLQHRLSHQVPWLWRLHRVHHSDVDLDVSSALRFHPFEVLFSLCYKIIWIITLGVNPLGFLIFEIILNFMAMFNHSNLALPVSLEKLLRKAVVTPQFHLVHHSSASNEMNKNFGFNLSLWDWCFGSYLQTRSSKETGLNILRERSDQRPERLLLQPLNKSSAR